MASNLALFQVLLVYGAEQSAKDSFARDRTPDIKSCVCAEEWHCAEAVQGHCQLAAYGGHSFLDGDGLLRRRCLHVNA